MSIRRALAAIAVVLTSLGVASPAFADPGQPKVTICHGSANHYVLITIDANGLNGHFDGTAPGHGPRNLPDRFPGADGTCNSPTGGGGGVS